VTLYQLFVGAVAVLTVVGFGILWVGLPAYFLLRFGRPGGLESEPWWKIVLVFPTIGFAIVFAYLAILEQKGEEDGCHVE
jgi:hypothetical protein